jgi:hypothetical protein
MITTLAMKCLGGYLKVGTTAVSILVLAIVICISQKKRNGTQTATMMNGIVLMTPITQLSIYDFLICIFMIQRESVARLLRLTTVFQEIQVITPTKIKME